MAEISNPGDASTDATTSSPNKYLIDPNTGPKIFNKPFKENDNRVWAKGTGKWTKKDIHQPARSKQAVVVENIEDSDVLKSLHKDLLNSVVAMSLAQGSDSSNTVSIDANPEELGNKVQQVVISGATNFELAASELKEAMEVAI